MRFEDPLSPLGEKKKRKKKATLSRSNFVNNRSLGFWFSLALSLSLDCHNGECFRKCVCDNRSEAEDWTVQAHTLHRYRLQRRHTSQKIHRPQLLHFIRPQIFIPYLSFELSIQILTFRRCVSFVPQYYQMTFRWWYRDSFYRHLLRNLGGLSQSRKRKSGIIFLTRFNLGLSRSKNKWVGSLLAVF